MVLECRRLRAPYTFAKVKKILTSDTYGFSASYTRKLSYTSECLCWLVDSVYLAEPRVPLSFLSTWRMLELAKGPSTISPKSTIILHSPLLWPLSPQWFMHGSLVLFWVDGDGPWCFLEECVLAAISYILWTNKSLTSIYQVFQCILFISLAVWNIAEGWRWACYILYGQVLGLSGVSNSWVPPSGLQIQDKLIQVLF